MKTLSVVLAALLEIGACQASTLILDVDAPFGGTKTNYTSFGQTFTPNHTGILSSLGIKIASSSPTFTVTIWEYEPATATLGKMIGSQAIASSKTFSSYGWAVVQFTNAIPQVAGKPMAFTIQGGETFWGPAISSLGKSTYSGGDFFEFSGNPQILPITRDLVFQTVVTIPESSVPMTLAAAVVLAAFRRRRTASSLAG